MMFRPELAAKVLAGEKTVTRRATSDNPNSPWWREACALRPGRNYAVQPGRGKPGIGRVTVTAVRLARLGRLDDREAAAEGFADAQAFADTFAGLNGGNYDPTLMVWVIRLAPVWTRPCARCNDDGWLEVWSDDGDAVLAQHDCPDLNESWHRPFNASGLLAGTY